MKKYYFTIAAILVLVAGMTSCSNEENETQNQVQARPILPILDRTVNDIDDNTYKIITVGNQTWTKSNLNVSKYNDGTPIPEVTDVMQWRSLTTGAWCYYQNNTANGPIYGKLYNWYAVMGIYDEASRTNPALRKKLAPIGWHIPSSSEWIVLSDFLGGVDLAGGKMKTTGTYHWISPNSYATNQSNFSGLPGGNRTDLGSFSNLGYGGNWWSRSTHLTAAVYYSLTYISNRFPLFYVNPTYGYSVRCLKDMQ